MSFKVTLGFEGLIDFFTQEKWKHGGYVFVFPVREHPGSREENEHKKAVETLQNNI